MYNKAVNTYPSALQFVPKYYHTQEVCDQAVSILLCSKIVSIDIRLKKRVMKLLMIFYQHYKWFLISLLQVR